MKKMIWLVGCVLALSACAEGESDSGTKPQANLDAEHLEEKADGISNRWTTVISELPLNDSVEATIDYPDWFHGYTLSLEAGQEISLRVAVDEESMVRFYGPKTHTGWDGAPKFGRALLAQDVPAGYMLSFEYTAEEAGDFMVVVGPKYVWRANYSITTESEIRCESDDQCPSSMSCEHNGVFCITSPCDVSYSVCVPREECASDEDCNSGWCAFTEDGSRACKDYVKEGESCGGFRMAHFVDNCEPELICASPYDIVADVPGVCAMAEVSVSELRANPEFYNGRVVVVRGALKTGYGFCTKMACPDTNPCCNSCGSELLLVDQSADSPDSGIGFHENGQALGCSGNECNFMDNCDVDPGNVWSVGEFRWDAEWQTMTFDAKSRWARP